MGFRTLILEFTTWASRVIEFVLTDEDKQKEQVVSIRQSFVGHRGCDDSDVSGS